MRPLTALATGLVLIGCTPENSRDTVTFSCEAPDAADPGTDRRVVFHFEDRFLFVTNDSGGADNVCTQVGTRLCSTMLNINRDTGAFTFHQEGCDPDSDMHLTGLCDMQVKD